MADSLLAYALYRYFDARDIPLYIGISGDLAIRDKSHIASSKWMQFTARSTIERHKTLEDVKRAERVAIETERPIFNQQYNNTPEAKARMRGYLEGVGRPDLLPPAQEAQQKSAPAAASHPVLTLKCVGPDGSRPWVPGYIGFPEAHDLFCEPGMCLGRMPEEAAREILRSRPSVPVDGWNGSDGFPIPI